MTLTATDDLAGIASTAYSVDGGAWQAYSAPFVLATDGNHSVEFRSTDGVGNVEAAHQAYVLVDQTAPTVQEQTAGRPGNGGWYVTDATITLNATDSGSGVASVSYRIDGGAWTAYTGPFAVGDGSHTVGYEAGDAAGNTASVRNATFKVDTTPPVLTSLEPSGHVTTSEVGVTWVGSDTESGIADYAISVDGGSFRDLGTSNSTTLTLSDGVHTIAVRATDAAGNTYAQTTTVTVDTKPSRSTGPYGSLPTILLVVAVAAVLVVLLWIWRRRKVGAAPPEEPPVPPRP